MIVQLVNGFSRMTWLMPFDYQTSVNYFTTTQSFQINQHLPHHLSQPTYLGYLAVDSRQISPKDGMMLQILDLISLACVAGCKRLGIT